MATPCQTARPDVPFPITLSGWISTKLNFYLTSTLLRIASAMRQGCFHTTCTGASPISYRVAHSTQLHMLNISNIHFLDRLLNSQNQTRMPHLATGSQSPV
jgi:hypothetical protein